MSYATRFNAGSALEIEDMVRESFERRGHTTTDSSDAEDRNLDIDFWLRTKDMKLLAVSVKWQRAALKTGNVAFEFEVTTKFQMTEPGWFETGEADVYAVVVGNKLYIIWKRDVVRYVNAFGWDKVRSLNSKNRAKQESSGHYHANAKVGLLRLDELERMGLAKVYAKYNPVKIAELTASADG